MDILANAALSGGIGKSFLAYASIEGKFGVGGSGSRGVSREEIINSALSTTQNESFQQNFQQINDYARSQTSGSSIDAGSRDSYTHANALDQLYSKQLAYQSAESYLEQISENESWYKQNSHLIKHSLNDAFIAWADAKFEGGYSQVRDILSRDRPEEIQPLVQEFVQSFIPERNISSLNHKENFDQEVFAGKMKMGEQGIKDGNEEIIQKLSTPLLSESKELKKEEIFQGYQAYREKHFNETDKVQDKLDKKRHEGIDRFDQNNERYLLGRLWDGLDKSENLSHQFKISEASFWMKGEE